jgi:hypothetical protein
MNAKTDRESRKDGEMANQEFQGVTICRSIVDGQRGYTVTFENGVRSFNFSLERAFREILHVLAHSHDRDIMIVGEPEEGNAW